MMPKPSTLRNIAGLPGTPADLSQSALLMIDLQNTYRQGVMQLHGDSHRYPFNRQ